MFVQWSSINAVSTIMANHTSEEHLVFFSSTTFISQLFSYLLTTDLEILQRKPIKESLYDAVQSFVSIK